MRFCEDGDHKFEHYIRVIASEREGRGTFETTNQHSLFCIRCGKTVDLQKDWRG